MPKVVREHEILRVAAHIGEGPKVESAEAARREVLAWAQKRSGGQLPPEAWNLQSFEFLSGGRNSAGVRIVGDTSDIWAIRADDPDKTVAGRVWTTEVVVGHIAGQSPRFSARLLVSTSEDQLDIEPHTPGFVQQVVDKCGLSCGGYELRAEPWIVESTPEAEHLADTLVEQSRRFPVFVLSVPEDADDSRTPLLDANALSRAMMGIGHVTVLPAIYTWVLTERFGKVRSVFGGAVRAYLPGFTEDSSPYAHRLVLGDQIGTPEEAAQCARWMRWLAAAESVRRNRLGDDVLAFKVIKNASLELQQQQLVQEGASDSKQLAMANARIKALEDQAAAYSTELEYFDSEHKKAEERAETAEEQLRASTFRLQQVLDQLKSDGGRADENISLPRKWSDLANWCEVNLAGRVTLSSTARRGVRAPEFDDIGLVVRCLLWLANDCRERRVSGGHGSLNEEVVEEGVRNSRCGADEFDLDWQGQRHTADWHIKNGGNTRDPRRCLRIYYFWHPATQQIVVADMPAHRRSGAS